jgi:small GTP-binding protein
LNSSLIENQEACRSEGEDWSVFEASRLDFCEHWQNFRHESFSMMRHLKFVTAGDSGVGKTCLHAAFNGEAFPQNYIPTCYGSYTARAEISGVSRILMPWDPPGKDEYARVRPLSYHDTDAVLLCFALDCKQSFRNASEKWLFEVRHYCETASIILIGTKSDLRQAGNPHHVTDEEARQLMDSQNCAAFIPCSAKSGDGITRILPAVVRACDQALIQDHQNHCLFL